MGLQCRIPIALKENLGAFPYRVGEWKGNESAWFKSEEYFPGIEHELKRTYNTDPARSVYLYIGYYQSQNQDKRLISFHSRPMHQKARAVSSKLVGFGPQTVNHTVMDIEGKQYETLFWFRLPSGDLTGRYQTKLATLMDALSYRQNYGAVILLATSTVKKNIDKDSIISMDLQGFIQDIAPLLNEFLS